ncbi:ArsR/SmtB family transcription factor [Methylobacterium nodulans]|uniref:Transcriptional regulator, ArsR family n=1 Tax=Methylobacterium nodulans (strain LMG 21967 / CNCM I-2342 / ORS 2060) TaxID=460265 RepID=B8IV00_METNO|nr:metalloregulator ArsR/SmtB family transcription factor [Methylobacterium nodulans]ACL59058.1 transcriptional regulator, ArsR family [Methylobacterium nodulans ORS 2060]
MVTTASIAEIGAMIGDPARVAMLQALMGGRALSAGELAAVAGIAPQTASGHLAQLTASGLLAVTRQGRHRYHRLAAPAVARLLESLMQVAGTAAATPRTGPRDERLRLARTCYDHIAGRLGVALADALAAAGWIELGDEAGLVTPEGLSRLTALGLDLSVPPHRGRAVPLCRPCLDWSERRPHLAGRLGAALCTHGLAQGWIRRQAGSRALAVTPEGRRAYREVFRVELA